MVYCFFCIFVNLTFGLICICFLLILYGTNVFFWNTIIILSTFFYSRKMDALIHPFSANVKFELLSYIPIIKSQRPHRGLRLLLL